MDTDPRIRKKNYESESGPVQLNKKIWTSRNFVRKKDILLVWKKTGDEI
jgi:hypothetical protein